MSEWYQVPYPTNPNPPSVSLPRQVKVGMSGDDVIAYKRAISRGGRWPWQQFDNYYSQNFSTGSSGNVKDTGVKGFQRQMKLTQDGIVGQQTFDAMRKAMIPKELANGGQPLFDSTCLNLLKGMKPPPSSSGDQKLVDYAKASIANEPKIHYSQNRPMTHLGVPPSKGFTCDCSGHATGCFYEAGYPDPNKSGYNGYGWTGTLVSNPKCSAPYKIGDMGLYGTSESNTTHVVTCYVPGSANASCWVSHGSEGGPYSVQLYYRSDLVCVVRPAKS